MLKWDVFFWFLGGGGWWGFYLTEVGISEVMRRRDHGFEYHNENQCPFIQGHVQYLDLSCFSLWKHTYSCWNVISLQRVTFYIHVHTSIYLAGNLFGFTFIFYSPPSRSAVISLSKETPKKHSKLCSFWQLSCRIHARTSCLHVFQTLGSAFKVNSTPHLSMNPPSESICDTKRQRSLRSCLIFPIGYTFIPLSAADHP